MFDFDADFPAFEPDLPHDQHITYTQGVARAAENGEQWKKLRLENMRRITGAKHVRSSHVA